MCSVQQVRNLCTSAALCSRKNFKKFSLFEMRGDLKFKKDFKKGYYPEFEHRFSRGVRQPYLPKGGQEFVPDERDSKDRWEAEAFPEHWPVPPNQSRDKLLVKKPIFSYRSTEPYEKEFIPEMIPELIVPDLEGFKLKPYVSYRVSDIDKPEFTAQDLFHAIYTDKIVANFQEGKLNEDGSPMDPSPEEALTKEEAMLRTKRTGSDYI